VRVFREEALPVLAEIKMVGSGTPAPALTAAGGKVGATSLGVIRAEVMAAVRAPHWN
jgi:hypothetical protein